jgi:hypothetical protein
MNRGQSKDDFDFNASIGLAPKSPAPSQVLSAPIVETATVSPKNSLGDLGEL